MSSSEPKLDLKPQPDGYGFIYGELRDGDDSHIVNIMPPVSHWSGDFKLTDYEPHETDWVLSLDGEEIARVKERDQIKSKLITKLLS